MVVNKGEGKQMITEKNDFVFNICYVIEHVLKTTCDLPLSATSNPVWFLRSKEEKYKKNYRP